MTLALFLGILFAALYQASILVLVTLAITLIFKTSYTTNFAQGSIGTFTTFFATIFHLNVLSKAFPNLPSIVVVIFAIILSMIFGFLIGLFIDVILIRKSKFSNPLSKQMITMGMVLVLTGLVSTIYIDYLSNPPSTPGFFKSDAGLRIALFGNTLILQYQRITSILISATVVTIIFLLLKYTKWGLGVRATASNEKVASMMGVNTKLITAMSWGIASGIGSLAAILFATTQTLNSGLMVFMQVNGFLAAVLGGFSTFYGPVVGAIIIPLLNGYTQRYIGMWSLVFIYALILLVILIKPVGLFGKKIAKKV